MNTIFYIFYILLNNFLCILHNQTHREKLRILGRYMKEFYHIPHDICCKLFYILYQNYYHSLFYYIIICETIPPTRKAAIQVPNHMATASFVLRSLSSIATDATHGTNSVIDTMATSVCG